MRTSVYTFAKKLSTGMKNCEGDMKVVVGPTCEHFANDTLHIIKLTE